MRKGVYYPVSFSKHAKSKSCNNGEYSCTPPKECCNFKLGCCNPHSPQHVFFWSHWCSMFFVLVVFCVCGCGMWRRGRVRRPSDPRTPSSMPRASSYTSWCQPPQYSRCSSFLLPPPYSEQRCGLGELSGKWKSLWRKIVQLQVTGKEGEEIEREEKQEGR
ncbi:hypothetical protein M8J75_003501 [Diaphorina citri]|nr:hypothetical protein M8J75_003501 [Diaphorina citri]